MVVKEDENPEIRALSTVLLERLQFMRRAGISFKGARDLYEVLGYPRILSYPDYRARYARGGISKRIVEAYPKATWRGGVEIIDDENPETSTEFEQAFEALEKRLKIWTRLQRVDILAGLSNYAVLLLGAPGDLSTELPRAKGPDSLLYLTPFSGGGGPGGDQLTRSMAMNADASIQAFEVDPQSPRFGLPLTYQLKRTDLSSPLFQRPVHCSRIIHIAEGLLGDEVYGTPALENVWNLLDDLDKVTGGGSEAFWLRANQGLHLNIDKDMKLPDAKDSRDALKEQAEDYTHQISRWIRTRGVEINTLGSDTANFSGPADAILTQIAGSKGIPKRLLLGSEMGQLASGQDADNWNTQVQDRRTSYAGPCIVRPLVDRLIEYGYLPQPKDGDYDVAWPTIEELTETEKADLAVKMVTVNKTQGAMVFTPSYIREKTFRLPPLTPEEDKPLTAPERVNATPGQAEEGALTAAEEADVLRVLEAALEANDVETVDRICGLRHAGGVGSGWFAEGGHVPGALGGGGEVKPGYHVVEHVAGGGVVGHGVFATKKEAHAVGMKLRREGRASTYVHHSDDIKKYNLAHA